MCVLSTHLEFAIKVRFVRLSFQRRMKKITVTFYGRLRFRGSYLHKINKRKCISEIFAQFIVTSHLVSNFAWLAFTRRIFQRVLLLDIFFVAYSGHFNGARNLTWTVLASSVLMNSNLLHKSNFIIIITNSIAALHWYPSVPVPQGLLWWHASSTLRVLFLSKKGDIAVQVS